MIYYPIQITLRDIFNNNSILCIEMNNSIGKTLQFNKTEAALLNRANH